jgi:two-component sensor histidine kinase
MTGRLGFQLAFILAVVLLPLAFISLAKSLALVKEVQARTEAALLGETMQAAATELRFIQEARGAAALLAKTIAPVIGDDAACSQMLTTLAAGGPQYALIAFIPVTGMMRCSSYGAPVDLSGHPVLQDVLDLRQPDFFISPRALTTEASVLGVTNPVFDGAGEFVGAVLLSLPHSTLMNPPNAAGIDAGLTRFTFDHSGRVLTASGGLDDRSALPRDRSLAALAGDGPLAFTAPSEAGPERVFSVVPLVPGELYALGTRVAKYESAFGWSFALTPILLPALMWLASLIAAWLAVERLVARNVRKLSRSITSFASGARIVGDIDVAKAPLEIREMADAYATMTQSILRDEAELENTIHQKEVLLREVHHRVKNNLQLIASIMNLQVRRVKSAEARQMLTELRDRVMTLATINRELFETAGRADVHSDELLTRILRQVAGTGLYPNRRFEARTELEDIAMVPDQAVPLGLLVGQALTSAVKHGADPDGKGVPIDIALRRDSSGGAILDMVNSIDAAQTADAPRAGLGTQLIAAFAMQLGGEVERGRHDGTYHLRVTFPLRPLSEAELRHPARQET